MSTTALVWLVVGLVSLIAVLAVSIALFRHLMVLGRAVGRFQDEVAPLAREAASLAEEASSRGRHVPGATGPVAGPGR